MSTNITTYVFIDEYNKYQNCLVDKSALTVAMDTFLTHLSYAQDELT